MISDILSHVVRMEIPDVICGSQSALQWEIFQVEDKSNLIHVSRYSTRAEVDSCLYLRLEPHSEQVTCVSRPTSFLKIDKCQSSMTDLFQ